MCTLTKTESLKSAQNLAELFDNVDFFLISEEDKLDSKIQNIENMIVSLEELDQSLFRIGKVINHIVQWMEMFRGVQSLKDQGDALAALNEYISMVLRCSYVIENSQLANILLKQPMVINIGRDFCDLSIQITENMLLYCIPGNLADNLQRFFCFILQLAHPFMVKEAGLFEYTLNKIMDRCKVQPSAQLYQLLGLLYFVKQTVAEKLYLGLLLDLSAQLSKAMTATPVLAEASADTFISLVELLMIIAKDPAAAKILQTEFQLHQSLYTMIKLSNSYYVQQKQALWTENQSVILSILSLLQLIIHQSVDKNFINMLLEDFLLLLEKEQYAFANSVLVPLIQGQETQVVPVCFHKVNDVMVLKQTYLLEVKQLQEKSKRALAFVSSYISLFVSSSISLFGSSHISLFGSRSGSR